MWKFLLTMPIYADKMKKNAEKHKLVDIIDI